MLSRICSPLCRGRRSRHLQLISARTALYDNLCLLGGIMASVSMGTRGCKCLQLATAKRASSLATTKETRESMPSSDDGPFSCLRKDQGYLLDRIGMSPKQLSLCHGRPRPMVLSGEAHGDVGRLNRRRMPLCGVLTLCSKHGISRFWLAWGSFHILFSTIEISGRKNEPETAVSETRVQDPRSTLTISPIWAVSGLT